MVGLGQVACCFVAYSAACHLLSLPSCTTTHRAGGQLGTVDGWVRADARILRLQKKAWRDNDMTPSNFIL